jgi:dTDP-4-amino-4,6-dideoxygalactose transaminase
MAEPIPARLPVLRPRLPTAERLLPYLQRMDAARTYSNYGPLVVELERRLARHFALAEGTAVTASSGLAALIGATLALAGRASAKRPLAVVPGYTFVGTGVAVEQCGYAPLVVDVDPQTWQLDADRLRAHPRLAEVGLVMPVAPYGRPVPQAPWRSFRDDTGIPVVIDGAAAFDPIAAAPREFLGDVPVALSFHATKAYATGEGGAVLGGSPGFEVRATRALNFGFYADRNSRGPSINGKMSEYHAAVGLAEFDGWDEKLAAMRAVAANYRAALSAHGLAERFHGAPDVGANYVLFDAGDAAGAARVQREFTAAHIDFRWWYGDGLHRQEHFQAVPRDELPVTEAVAARVLGLPFAPDLADADVQRVVAALARASA